MKLSLIVLGALVASVVLRHRSAAMRHWVLAAGLVCAAAVPALETVVPVWRLPVGTPAAFESYQAPAGTVVSAGGAPRMTAPAASARRPQTNAPARRLNVTAVLPWMWAAGTMISLSVLVVGMLRLGWLAARANRLTRGRWSELAADISRAYQLRRPVALLQSEHPSLLVTWGLARPKVILPASADGWSEERARVVLTHELAHIRRGDWIVQLSAELLRAIYWFNPLLWVACRRLRLESEHACDDEVMNHGVGGTDYANHLIELARSLNRHRASWFPAPAMARPSSLERRVRAMLNDHHNRAPVTRTTRAAVFVSLLVAAAAIAAAQGAFVSLTGSVSDEHGRGIPGVTVILSNEQRQMKYEVKTADNGRFEFLGLVAGSYGFEARGIGFKAVKETIEIAGQNLQRNITLKIGSLQETISVRFDDAKASGPPKPVEVTPRKYECIASTEGGRIVPPKKIRDLAPQYPESLRGTGTEGTVVMEARIGVDGYVGDIRIIGNAHPDLEQAAVAAVREWRYTETLLNCQPVDVMMTINVNFKRATPQQ